MANLYREKRRRFVIVRRSLLIWWVSTELSVTVSLHPKSFTWTTFTESSPQYDALQHSLLICKVSLMLVPLMVSSWVTGKSLLRSSAATEFSNAELIQLIAINWMRHFIIGLFVVAALI